ncbi:MAG: hypothetical protein K0Q53_417 [Massilibacillus sp.]|nr:hypothetical protein [Massilibacillus sp.]
MREEKENGIITGDTDRFLSYRGIFLQRLLYDADKWLLT